MRRGPAALAVLALCAAAAAGALEWPVERPIVTGTFGEYRGDHFHLGLDIGGGEQVVHPVLAGELVFRYEENADYSSLPRGVGSYAVIRHPDDVLSVYCHLRRDLERPARTVYTVRDAVGVIGDTGYSAGKHLHFMVFDVQAGSFVNPLSLLPPVADRDVGRHLDRGSDPQVFAGPADRVMQETEQVRLAVAHEIGRASCRERV